MEGVKVGKIEIPIIKGEDGQQGLQGKQGVGIASIEQIVESTENDGINVIEVTLDSGQKSTFNVKNGSAGQGSDVYDDTELRNLIENNLAEAKKYTDTEIANFDFVKIVDALPEIGLPNRVYFVPKTESDTNNIFDEYAWINDTWEYFGTKVVEIDLTNINAQIENLEKNKQDNLSAGDNIKIENNVISSLSDGILTGSVIGWNDDIIPEGYEEVEDIFSDFVKARGHIENFTDYNQIYLPGVYRINKITTNAPSYVSDWGAMVIVFSPFKGSTNLCTQLVISGDGVGVAMRNCWYGTWTDWKSLG